MTGSSALLMKILALLAWLKTIIEIIINNPAYDIYPNGLDQTLALRPIFATGGALAPGRYKVSKLAEPWIFRTATNGLDVSVTSPGAVIELQVDPLAVGTLPQLWIAYGNGVLTIKGIKWTCSTPLEWVGKVLARDANTVTFSPWPGEPAGEIPFCDTFAYLKDDPRDGMAVFSWNRDKDENEGALVANPIVDNGDGTRTLTLRDVFGTVTSIASYNPLTLNVTYSPAGGPATEDIMILNAPGAPSVGGVPLDGRVFIVKTPSDDDEGLPGPLTTIRLVDASTGKSINASSADPGWTGAGATIVKKPIDTALCQVGDPFLMISAKRAMRPFMINGNGDVQGLFHMLNVTGLGVNAKGNDRWNAGIFADDADQLFPCGASPAWIKDTGRAPVFPMMVARGTGDTFLTVSGMDIGKTYVSGAGTTILKSLWTDSAVIDNKPVKPKAGEILYLVKPDGSRTADIRVLGLDPADQSAAGGVLLDTALPGDLAIDVYKIVNRTRSKGGQFTNGFIGERCVTTGTAMVGEGVFASSMSISGAHNSTRCSAPNSRWSGSGASTIGGGVVPALRIRNSGWKFRFGESSLIYRDRINSLGDTSAVFEDVDEEHFGIVDLRTFGYGAVSISGQKCVIDSLNYERGGLLRGARSAGDPVAANDLHVGAHGELTIGRLLVPFPTTSWYEHATGYLTVLSGSGLVNPGAIAAGAVTIVAAKKVKAGHEALVRVMIGGVEQDPSSYTANGTATLTFAAAPVQSGGPVPYSVRHTGC